MNDLVRQLGVELPILQAPMVGVSTPALAAAVSNAGALGAIGISGAPTVEAAREQLRAVRALTHKPFNVNLFCHREPKRDEAREKKWLELLSPHFERFEAKAPAALTVPYPAYVDDAAMISMLCDEKPKVVSFHFGAPRPELTRKLKDAGIVLLATATSLAESFELERAGIDAVVAQGIEAGGHRGTFDAAAPDDRLGTFALVRLLVDRCRLPVIAAGGIMDGAGIAAAMVLGASAAQLGTAFIGCPESGADSAYRAALAGEGAEHTVLTQLISGRPARCLANRFTALRTELDESLAPAYPVAYSAGKALIAAAREKGEPGFAAQWAGQGAPLARSMAATRLVATLERERGQAAKALAPVAPPTTA